MSEKCCGKCRWYKLTFEHPWPIQCTHPDCYPGMWSYEVCPHFEAKDGDGE